MPGRRAAAAGPYPSGTGSPCPDRACCRSDRDRRCSRRDTDQERRSRRSGRSRNLLSSSASNSPRSCCGGLPYLTRSTSCVSHGAASCAVLVLEENGMERARRSATASDGRQPSMRPRAIVGLLLPLAACSAPPPTTHTDPFYVAPAMSPGASAPAPSPGPRGGGGGAHGGGASGAGIGQLPGPDQPGSNLPNGSGSMSIGGGQGL